MTGGRNGENPEDGGARSDGLDAAIGRLLLPASVRRRYAAKFLLSLLVVVVVIAGVGVVSYVQIQGIIEDEAEDTLRSTATLQADSVAEWLGGMRVRARAVASSDVYGGGDSARIRAYLEESESVSDGDVVGVHYVDSGTETVLASTNREFEGRPPAAISPAVTRPITAAANGTETVATSRSAYSRTGGIRMAFASEVRGGHGVVVVVGDVARDFEQLHGSRSGVRTEVLDADGRGVLTPRRTYASDLAATDGFRRAVAGQTTTVERESDVVGIAPVPDTNWVVATTAPKSELYRASDTVGRNVVVLVSASLVALGAVGVVLGRQTVVPLTRLRRRTREMEAGDLDVDLTTRREDEIGRLFVAFGNMRDALREQIREAERAREETEASRQELARQNQRLDHFASTVSHDLRNPLTVARGNLKLLEDRLDEFGTGTEVDGDDADAPARLLDRIDRAHERIDAIIADVLALARGGKRIEETATVDLETVARDAWGTVDTAEATLTVAGTRTIDADRDRLRRALENLFRNAVDHVGPEASISVGLTDDGFYVADDGPGISVGEADAVFEYGHTTSDQGTGLGLSIVQTIAEAHGWQIGLDTDYDGGAKFVVSDVFGAES